MWQNIMLAAGGLIFSIALLPSVMSKNKPSKWTCLITGVVLACFVVVYASQKWWYGMMSNGLTAAMWFTLLFQQLRKGGK